MKPEVDWPKPPRRGWGHRDVEAILGSDGLLRTLDEDGSWKMWMPLKQARQRLESLLFALLVIAISSFLFGMFAQWVQGTR